MSGERAAITNRNLCFLNQCLAKIYEALAWVIGSGMVFLAAWKIYGLICWKDIQTINDS
jgi:hypothetical protein